MSLRTIIFILFIVCRWISAATVDLTLSHETAPSGGVVQIKMNLSPMVPITGGSLVLFLDPSLFASIERATILDFDGEAAATIQGTRVALRFTSPHAEIGKTTPLAVLSARLKTGLRPGTVLPVTLSSATLIDDGGEELNVNTISGAVAIAGNLFISDAAPAGAVVSLLGGGFTRQTLVEIDGIAPTEITFVNRSRIDVALPARANLSGRRVRLSQSGEEAIYFPHPRQLRLEEAPADPLFASTKVTFGNRTSSRGYMEVPSIEPGQLLGLAVQNPTASEAIVSIQLQASAGEAGQSVTRAVGPRASWIGDLAELFPQGSRRAGILVETSVPLKMLGLRGFPSSMSVEPFALDRTPRANLRSPVTPATSPPVVAFSPGPPIEVGLAVNPQGLNFTHFTAESAPPPQSFTVTHLAGAQVNYTAAVFSLPNWIVLDQSSGITPSQRTVTVDPAGLGPGTYSAAVQVNSAGIASAVLSIGLTVVSGTRPNPPAGNRFVPVAPCRIADTRLETGPFGGPSIAAGATRDFVISSGVCGVPANAAAYSLNATVVPAVRLSFLTLWPSGATRPVVSTLNSFDGSITSNAAIVPAGNGGAISAFATDRTDLILDINGYFTSSTQAETLVLYPVTPCRIADTRLPAGPFGGPTMNGAATREFAVPASPCPIPASAKAYSLNMTVVPSGPLSFLTTYPTGKDRPNVSTLNSTDGSVKANAAIVPAGNNGAVSVFVTDRTDVVIDINGYFAPPGGAGGLLFFPVNPCRLTDTRVTPGAMLEGGSIFNIPVTSNIGDCRQVALTAAAFSTNVTALPATTLSFLTIFPAGITRPLVSTLNSFTGKVVANAAIVPAGTGSGPTAGAVSIYVTDPSHLVVDLNGYFAP